MRFSIITITFLLSALFFTHIMQYAQCTKELPKQYEHIEPGNIVAAYFGGWDVYRDRAYTVQDIYPIAHKLTHVIYAFAKPNVQKGICELPDPWADLGASQEYHKKLSGNFANLLELKKQFPHLKILLSIGGGTDSVKISEIVRKGYQNKFVVSCISLLDAYDYTYKHSKTGKFHTVSYSYPQLFDGIDLDWEWPHNKVPKQEALAFVEMIKMFRTLLHKRQQLTKSYQFLTVALQINSSVYQALQLNKVSQFIDWFNIMAYNFAGTFNSSVGFNAPICNSMSIYSVDNAIHGIIQEGVSPEKLVLGIPLYGYLFDQTNGKLGAPFKKTDIAGSLSYHKIKDLYLDNPDCNYNWHVVSKVPYLHCPQDNIFISFDDQRSIKEKVLYARQNRLKGIVLWRLAHDDDNHSLVNAI